MIDSTTNLDTNGEWQCIRKQEGYTICQSGSHIRGNFVQVFVPDSPSCDQQGKWKLITYLHGFALCLPKFYEEHLEILAKQGYYVFFPDFQTSDYPDNLDQDELTPSQNKHHLYFWYQMVIDTITDRKTPSTEKFVEQKRKAKEFHRIREAPGEPSRLTCLMIALALVVIILVVRLIYLFRPKFSKNLVKLISTVGLSLLYSPSDWIERSISLTSQSWHSFCQDNPALHEIDFDFYVFGHSLGGLLALSWPAYVAKTKFFPKQILTADPAPNSEMGIPKIAIFILKLFRAPFTSKPILIRDTGPKLDIPVGILHGADDDMVKPKSWIQRSPGNQKANFDYIASPKKAIYFSLSNKQANPALIAFHNQAVTDTTYFDDALFKDFGGVKDEPNAYNYQYIWPGLHLVVENQVEADDLLNQFPLETIKVTSTLPAQLPRFTWSILLGLALFSCAYWFWHAGAVLLRIK